MAGGLVQIPMLDAGSVTRQMTFWSDSGTITGNLYPAPVEQGTAIIGSVNLALGSTAISATNPLAMLDAYTAPVAWAAWNSGTAVNTAATVATAGMDTVIVTLVGSGLASGVIIFEVNDGAAWITIKAGSITDYSTASGATLSGGINRGYQVGVAGFPSFRVRLSSAITAGSLVVTTISSSAPDTSIVTVGMDPSQALPAGTNSIGTVLGPLPAAPITGQQISTAGAVALPVGTLLNGLVITALTTNTGTIYVGPSAVTVANGYPLGAGQSISFAVANSSSIYIIGTNTTDKVAYAGN